jgi:hypothetical protein
MYIPRLLQEHELSTPMMTHDICQRNDYHEIFHTFSVTCLNFELPNPIITNTPIHISTFNFLLKKHLAECN